MGEDGKNNGSESEATYGMVENIRKVINKRQCKSIDGDGRPLEGTFNDKVGPVHLKYKDRCPNIGGREQGAFILKTYDAGPVKTWVHLLATHPDGQDA